MTVSEALLIVVDDILSLYLLASLLEKTKYGPECVVGKDEFMMSWVSRWTDWLDFDNFRGPGGGSLFNRDCIDAVLGVSMIGTPSSSTPIRSRCCVGQPLGSDILFLLHVLAENSKRIHVNYYGFARLAWDATLTPSQIYIECTQRIFGP
jgi:hypothetical protein